jgi:formylglycine-generating enzyme required for sulfatase activity
MKHTGPHPAIWPLTCAILGVVLLAAGSNSLIGQSSAKLPVVEKVDAKGYTEAIPDSSVTFDMVPIPGGTYLMGSPASEAGHQADESPQHPVTVKPFWMGKCEVSWDEYNRYRKEMAVELPEVNEKKLEANADAITGPTKPYADETFGHGREGNPALAITYHAAIEYCRWLSSKTGKYYRLPTEAEWEWAARAGTTTAYFFGDDPAKLGDYAWYDKNAEEAAHKVGKKKASPWGLYDIYGNVAEWCVDHYKKDYYATFPLNKATLEPVLAPTGKRYSYVARGGSWTDPAEMCRSAARRGSEKDWLKRDPQRPQSIWWMTEADFVGFRVVRAAKEQENLKDLRSKMTRQSPDK